MTLKQTFYRNFEPIQHMYLLVVTIKLNTNNILIEPIYNNLRRNLRYQF